MAWGDSWGSSPSSNALRLAKAFHEGRELGGNQRDRVVVSDFGNCLYYYCRNRVIAKYTPPWLVAQAVAKAIDEGIQWRYEFHLEPVYCAVRRDKAEMRHLKALGVEAEFQYGRNPFLIFGADTTDTGYRTIADWKALPKWKEAPPNPRRPQPERFVNLTLPLFA